MIIFNGKSIIDIKVNEFTIQTGIVNNEIVYDNATRYIGALEINTGDMSEYGLIINNKLYTNIEVINTTNNEGLVITDNKIHFIKNGEYSIELKYKSVSKNIKITICIICILNT